MAGAGQIGQAHIKRILAEPATVLAAIVDPNPAVAKQTAELGVPWFSAVEAALAAAKPDGIIIATPNPLHAAVLWRDCLRWASVRLMLRRLCQGSK